MGARNIRIGDLVLVDDDGVERLAQVSGGYQLGRAWFIQLVNPPGAHQPGGRPYLPQHVKARQVRRHWRKAARS